MNSCIQTGGIAHVVGARPNFVKLAPVFAALRALGQKQSVIHTGQHFDPAMDAVFFGDLGLPRPDINLNQHGGSPAELTARILLALEPILLETTPAAVTVYGDVTSTAAAALTAAKCGLPVVHVEAGLRSFDRSMPEEHNRILVDHLADLLITTEESANANLAREGIPAERVVFAGNCMIDSLLRHLPQALAQMPWTRHGLTPGEYALVTLHRPGNVDDAARLAALLRAVADVARLLPVLFPLHPRTRSRLPADLAALAGVRICEPLPYLEFTGLMARARMVLTDSGGIQEETTCLGVPCLTLRPNTERPVTLTHGSNRLVGTDGAAIVAAAAAVLREQPTPRPPPPLWDGHAGERTAAAICRWLATARA